MEPLSMSTTDELDIDDDSQILVVGLGGLGTAMATGLTASGLGVLGMGIERVLFPAQDTAADFSGDPLAIVTPDGAVRTWTAEPVLSAVELIVIAGEDERLLRPHRKVTRGEHT